jgi:tetratricopeptide (TPR) repeat protein
VLVTRGDAAQALPLYLQAVTLQETIGAPAAERALALTAYGIGLRKSNREPEAEAALRRAVAASEEALGPNHPQVALGLAWLGATLRAQGRPEEALGLLERALRIREGAFGADSEDVGDALRTIGDSLRAARDFARAESYYRRALAVHEQLPDGQASIALLNNVGEMYTETGRAAEALPLLERALAASRALRPPDHPEIGMVQGALATALLEEGRPAEALKTFEQAEAQLGKRWPAEHPQHARTLGGIGRALLELGRDAQAVAPLERAVAIAGATPVEEADVDDLRFLLARSLWGARRDRARSVALARAARAGFAQRGEAKARALAAVDRWLAGER